MRGNPGKRGSAVVAVVVCAALGAGCEPGGTQLTGTDGGSGCVVDRECRDDDPCNGDEWCDDGECRAGEPAGAGTPCEHPPGAGECRGGMCAPAGCGDLALDPGEECDDGNLDETDGCDNGCRFLCLVDPDCPPGPACTAAVCEPFGTGRACRSAPVPGGSACNDGDPCTIGDVCGGGACAGEALDCDDGDPCTRDYCYALRVPEPGCINEPLPLWYPDEDGDGWGTGTDGVCAALAPPRHADRTGDCCDLRASVFPGRTGFFDAPYACEPDDPPSFDFDCSGAEEKETEVAAGECDSSVTMTYCGSVAGGWCADPALDPGCVGVPECGASGAWQSCVRYDYSYWPGGCDAGPGDDGGTDAADAGAGGADAGTGVADAAMDAGGAKVRETYVDAGARKESPSMYECCAPEFEVRVQRCR
jgi:cysteine-rich repeat protein